jgi:hypothetical protein
MTFDDVVSALYTLNEVPFNNSDENFIRIIPSMMLYADGRIYRELTFLATTTTQPITLIPFNREIVLPLTVKAMRAINVLTPAGPITNDSKRKSLERIGSEMLDFIWPQSTFRPGVPQKYAMTGQQQTLTILPPPPGPQPQVMQHVIRLMPTPDQAYPAEVLGDIRPDPLSEANPQTYLSVTYPELFIACCMIFASGYQRDFGAQSDDPRMAQSWETQYGVLKQGVMLEAARMRGMAPTSAALPGAP